MTSEAMFVPRDNRVVRLPLHDPVTDETLKGYLEIDVEFFLSSTRGLRSDQARIVEFVEYPDPTPEQEIEFIDKIISGLPADAVADLPNGVKLYDVNSLYPQEFTPKYKLPHERKSDALIAQEPTWKRIPEFDNYEMTPLGVIRNRWTKRVLEVAEDGDQKYVAMHDKDGYDHDVNVQFALEKTYGKK